MARTSPEAETVQTDRYEPVAMVISYCPGPGRAR